jgi:hypothetical protein
VVEMHHGGAFRPQNSLCKVRIFSELKIGGIAALAYGMKRTSFIGISLLAAASVVFAQSQGGWRRIGDPPQNPPENSQPAYDPPRQPAYDPPRQPAYDPARPPAYDPAGPPAYDPQSDGIPPRLTIPPGTFVTVRVNQPLSSDHNQPGDSFTATLVRPVVVDGIVIAQRGQTIGGRVAEAQKAGRGEGVARLAVQLTDLTLVDGQQVPIQSQLINRSGPGFTGQDAGTIVGTTAVGAAIGAAADWGRGAAIGGVAGAVVGVLLTRGHPSVIYPESVLTFRIEAPVSFSTERSPQAFRNVDPNDYQRNTEVQARRPPPPPPAPYYYGPGYYPPYPYYGYGYGPGFSFYYGPGFFYGRGYRRWR